MPDLHSFSALDRHAVLSGSDNGFAWYAGAMFADPGEAVPMRPEMLSQGVVRATMQMIGAKIAVAFEAAANWLSSGEAKALSAN
jgi:hypothetical protein